MAEPKEVLTMEDLSADLRREVTGYKKTLVTMAQQYGLLRPKMIEVAPKIIGLFRRIQGRFEERTFGLADFARMFDASVPTGAGRPGEPGYREHKMFYTLDYMLRHVRSKDRPKGQQGRRDPATDQLARFLATIQTIVVDMDPVYAAVRQEFNFTERNISRIKVRVENAEPILDLKAAGAKPVKVTMGNVVHMEREKAKLAEAEAQAAARGQVVRRVAAGLGVPGRRVRKSAA